LRSTYHSARKLLTTWIILVWLLSSISTFIRRRGHRRSKCWTSQGNHRPRGSPRGSMLAWMLESTD
jgi:hypothetical protein